MEEDKSQIGTQVHDSNASNASNSNASASHASASHASVATNASNGGASLTAENDDPEEEIAQEVYQRFVRSGKE